MATDRVESEADASVQTPAGATDSARTALGQIGTHMRRCKGPTPMQQAAVRMAVVGVVGM